MGRKSVEEVIAIRSSFIIMKEEEIATNNCSTLSLSTQSTAIKEWLSELIGNDGKTLPPFPHVSERALR
jgi:hypothetical protein